MTIRFGTLPLCLGLAGALAGQADHSNYDESKVGKYTLPDPLVLESGQRVRDAQTWFGQRRPEILRLFETNVYGRTPKAAIHPRFEVVSVDRHALAGKAIRKQVTIHFSDRAGGPRINLLLYVPASAGQPVPAFLGLNFDGNHTVHADPRIPLGEVWVRDPATKDSPLSNELVPHIRQLAKPETRGAASGQWQVERILSRGYALAAVYDGDIEPDFNGGLKYGVRALFMGPGQTEFAPDEWGTIGAWAWGLSRALDYLQSDSDIDGRKVAVMGHSRLGKTALWAGAQDTRFAMVVSNNSGEGGAALSKRNFGEDLEHLNTAFPHWFCANYHQYTHHEDRLPVDHHELLALIAPRPLYVASGETDLYSDPLGEFLSAVAAGPVYRLLGKEDLGTGRMPPIHQPILHTLAYHIRAGGHDVTAYDWDRYLDFADRQFGQTRKER